MEIANFVVAVSSLIATIVLTVVIYRLQKKSEEKRDKERKEDIEREKQEKAEELARNFIIDNQSEIDLLPWCAVASSVKSLPALQIWRTRRKYSHPIYLKFDKQPANVKKEILKQEGISLNLPDTCNWVADYLKRLKIDAFECGMSSESHCYLYDGAKYFHRGISDYWDEKLEGYPRIELPNIPIERDDKGIFGKYIPTFDDYINERVIQKFGEKSFLKNDAIPPLDFADYVFSNDSKKFVLCMMQFVRDFSIMVGFRSGEKEYRGTSNDRQVSTFEDYYYDALLELFLAYSEV